LIPAICRPGSDKLFDPAEGESCFLIGPESNGLGANIFEGTNRMALRVGFLGTGSIAQAHARLLLKLSDVQIIALRNRNVWKAQAFNEKLAGGKAV